MNLRSISATPAFSPREYNVALKETLILELNTGIEEIFRKARRPPPHSSIQLAIHQILHTVQK